MRSIVKLFAIGTVFLGVTACGNTMDRLNNINKEPSFSPIANPKLQADYKQVSLPMPESRPYATAPNSLWNVGRKSFFKDQRAAEVGDIVTVLIDVKDKAELDNKTERSRSAAEDMNMPGLFGLETQLTKVLPDAVTPDNLATVGSSSDHSGEGKIDREEKIELKVAAMIIQTLPNGNLVINGRQEMRVNYEVRELQVAGVIRPEDITTENTISYDKIAEARIAYGGRGTISDVQQPRYGDQVLDILLPF